LIESFYSVEIFATFQQVYINITPPPMQNNQMYITSLHQTLYNFIFNLHFE